jgi:hypothetical protein
MLSGAVAFAACLAVLVTTPADTYWINDCGNKALVAERLLETGYRELGFDYPAAEIDPAASAFPIVPPFAVAREEGFLSVFPPAYPALAAPFLAAFGPLGLRVPAALGVAACAGLLTLWLGAAVGSAWAFGAGAALALATPLFFYGITLWEHSLTVALSLGAWVLASRDAPARLFAAGLLVASACWLREELALMGIALAVACLVQWRRPAALLWLAAGALLPGLGRLLFNQLVYGTPLGVHLPAIGSSAAAAAGMPGGGAVSAARVLASVLAGFGRSTREAALLGAAALAALPIGWVAARRARWAAPALIAVTAAGLAAWVLGGARMFGAARPLDALARYNGLLVQMPMFCLAGFGLRRVWSSPEYAGIRVGVLAGALFLAFAVAVGMASGSSYGVQAGFGVHWGPRVLLPAFPALVALAVAAVRRESGPTSRRFAVVSPIASASLVAAGLLSSAHAVWFLAEQKADARSFEAVLRTLAPRYVVTTHPLLAQHVSALWDEKPMLLVRDPGSLARAVADLRVGGVRELLFVVPGGAPLVSGIDGLDCRLAARHRGPHLHYFDLDIQRCAFAGRG